MFLHTKQRRIKELAEIINADKEHAYAAPTYRVSGEIAELRGILLFSDGDCECVAEGLRFVTDCYRGMGRVRLALDCYPRLLSAGVECIKNGVKPDGTEWDFVHAVSDRNIKYAPADYFPRYLGIESYIFPTDECEDIKQVVAEVFPIELIQRRFAEGVAQAKRGLVRDCAELTDEYLAVIDDVERTLSEGDGRQSARGHVFEMWRKKKELLAERGVTWRTPAELNPRVMFD